MIYHIAQGIYNDRDFQVVGQQYCQPRFSLGF
jgi:hypothetical protein